MTVLEKGIARRLAIEDRAIAYFRRIGVRGRNTRAGGALAIAYVRRWKLSSPMFYRPEARA